MQRPAKPRTILRIGPTNTVSAREDLVAVEGPLTLTARDDVWLTTMRSPGHDRELIVGWLIHEGLVVEPDRDISSLSVCGQPGEPGYGDVYQLVPAAAMESRLRARDFELAPRAQTTSCGLCGHEQLERLVRNALTTRPTEPVEPAWSLPSLRQLFTAFGTSQPLFAQTGCTHAAALVNTQGEVLVSREDVGRHNAVDKLVGHLALTKQLPPGQDQALLVSSRASFEIVHKALAAGFGAVFSLSAPTSLAVEAAERSEILLAGFFRAGGFNVYSGHSRLLGEPP